MLGRSVEFWIAIGFLTLGLFAAFVWVPFDTETPPIYEFRRQTYVGDAMLPMVSAAGVALFAAIHLALTLMRPRTEAASPPFDVLTGVFFAVFFAIIIASLAVMYWAGPIALALFGPGGEEPVTYRQMRATLPWKYIGFVLGGFVMVFGLTSFIEGRVKWIRVISSILAVVVLILIFDVPFDTILLPPNGDF